ncbi:MAG: zf-HC2 domain-containing protein [Kiritimatiellae bacterium]|nr:zf-HC2 domain-containing protein [Kiritimatiellia bacterium]
MNCKEAIDIAEEAMDKDLPRAVKRRLDLHLSRCESCRRLFEAERAEHMRWFRIFNDPATMRRLPPDFADRLAAAAHVSHSGFWFRIPRWLKRAACFALFLSGVAFAATVMVDAIIAKDGEATVGRAVPSAPEATGGVDGSAAPVASAAMSDVPHVSGVASGPSNENPPSAKNQLEGEEGEAKTNIQQNVGASLAMAATPASAAVEFSWTGGNATLGDGKVTILCDGSGNVTNITARPAGGEELRITGDPMTFADGAKVILAAPASGSYADGSLVFANDVTAEGALALNRTDGAFRFYSGNRLKGVDWVDAFDSNGTVANDWNVHSAYASPTDAAASVSSNECPYGIYRPIPTDGKVCNRWSGKYTFSARFQIRHQSPKIQVRMLTGMRTTAGLYLPDTDTWLDTKYRMGSESDARWFWYDSTPVDGVTLQYGGDEYDFGICHIIFQHRNASKGTIGFAGEVTMAGTVAVQHGVKMVVMAKDNSTFAAPAFSGYGDVEYARNATLSHANETRWHSTMTVTNATVTVTSLGAIPMGCTVVVDNGGVLDFSQATGDSMGYKTDFEVRPGGKMLSYASASLGWWRFDGRTPFRLLGGTFECNAPSDRAQNYVYLDRLLMTDGAMLKCNKPFWVGNSKDGYWTIGGMGATVDCVQFLSLSASSAQKVIINVNDGATLTFAESVAYQPSYPQVDFIKTGGGTVVCRSTCQPTAIANGMKVQGGTWMLGASDIWLNAHSLTLDGGTIAGTDSTTNTLGDLTIGANGGVIELDPGAMLAFANSTNKTWSGMVIVKGFHDRAVRFGDSEAALARGQLDMIRAEKPGGTKMRLSLDINGYLAPLGLTISFR